MADQTSSLTRILRIIMAVVTIGMFLAGIMMSQRGGVQSALAHGLAYALVPGALFGLLYVKRAF